MTGQTRAVRGAELAYSTSGSGRPLIWGHGLSQTMAIENRRELINWSEVPARVVRYDARGHGLSETTSALDGYSWRELALDQLALADALEIESYIAAGASMGCGTALHAVATAPARVDALVLAIPPTGWESRAGQVDQWEQVARVIETEGVEPVITAREAVAPPDPYALDPDHRGRQAAGTRSWDPVRLAQVMRGAATADLPTRDTIAGIGVPTLILAWTGDPVHPMSTAEELHSLIDDSQLQVASTSNDLASWSSVVARFVADLDR